MSVAISQRSSNLQGCNFRKLKKYKFTSLSLSFQVRQRMYELLISFDDNVNYEFDREEIERALIELLNQSRQEIAYVTSNVFRYDQNQDGVITYEQFTNFCLEQHFGEMAIQRLHKKGIYSRGRERYMSRKEFFLTLEYCLSFIKMKPNLEELDIIFTDIDLDRDNAITYSQYFCFLNEYFGSQSESAARVTVQEVEKEVKDKSVPVLKLEEEGAKTQQNSERNSNADTNSKISKLQEIMPLANRIQRLVFHQLKITVMDADNERLLCSDKNIAMKILCQRLQLPQAQADDIVQKQFSTKSSISYEQLIQVAIQKYMCELLPVPAQMNKEQFINIVTNGLHFVKVKPFGPILESIFELCCYGSAESQLSSQNFKEIMKMMFSTYKWPRKTGELRSHRFSSPQQVQYKRGAQ